jgi:XTP/dITP diphosphohydrolase
MDLLIATQNKGKLREYQAMLAGLPVRVLSPDDVGLGKLDVPETEDTFAGNAELKASKYAQAAGMFALADDSGLCVDALDGAPGVHSARYAGEDATDADRRAKLLRELATVPEGKRGAHFVCAIVVFNPHRQTPYTSSGTLHGKIALAESSGPYGFGYDALFIPDGYNKTLADIEPDEKNKISHRGRAAEQMRPVIARLASL